MLRRRLTRRDIGHQYTRLIISRWTSSSAVPRKAQPPSTPSREQVKIAILPFDLSASAAGSLARILASTKYRDNRGNVLLRLVTSSFQALLSIIGLSFGLNKIDRKTTMSKIRAIYLPYWSIDAAGVLPAKSEVASAKARVIFKNARLPAHDQGALRSLPFDIPSPDSNKYDLLNINEHLKRNIIRGTETESFPFVVSPFIMPAMALGSDAFEKSIPTIDTTSIMDEDSRNAAIEAALQEMQIGSKKMQTNETIKFHGDQLSMDYFATSPVMLPFYLAEFTNSSDKVGEDMRELTVAISGWKSSTVQWAIRGESSENKGKVLPLMKDWQSNQASSLIKCHLYFNPRLPTSSSLDEESAIIRQEEDDHLMKIEDKITADLKAQNVERTYSTWKVARDRYVVTKKEIKKSAMEQLQKISDDEIRRDVVGAWYVSALIIKRLERLFEIEEPWKLLQRLTKQKFRKYQAGEFDYSPSTPESKAGMGSFIPWNKEQITAFGSDENDAHRKYFESLITLQNRRLRILTDERTLDEEGYYLYDNGKDAAKTIADLKASLVKDAPSWLLNYIQGEKLHFREILEKRSRGEEEEEGAIGADVPASLEVAKKSKGQRRRERKEEEGKREKEVKEKREREEKKRREIERKKGKRLNLVS